MFIADDENTHNLKTLSINRLWSATKTIQHLQQKPKGCFNTLNKTNNMHIFPFEKLNVYWLSVDFTDVIYELTEKFPEREKYELTKQVRRSAASVAANLAEESGRVSYKEQARFSEIAYGSLIESLNWLIIAQKRNYISEETIKKHRPQIVEIANKINALRRLQLSRKAKFR